MQLVESPCVAFMDDLKTGLKLVCGGETFAFLNMYCMIIHNRNSSQWNDEDVRPLSL